jgi:hypothetical protein
MTTLNEIHSNSERLLQEVEIWRFTVTAYRDILCKDAFLKEFLAFKIDIAQGFVEELQAWEETGNEAKCKYAIDNAEFFFGQIQVLFDRMFADQYQEAWPEMKEELIVTDYISMDFARFVGKVGLVKA